MSGLKKKMACFCAVFLSLILMMSLSCQTTRRNGVVITDGCQGHVLVLITMCLMSAIQIMLTLIWEHCHRLTLKTRRHLIVMLMLGVFRSHGAIWWITLHLIVHGQLTHHVTACCGVAVVTNLFLPVLNHVSMTIIVQCLGSLAMVTLFTVRHDPVVTLIDHHHITVSTSCLD